MTKVLPQGEKVRFKGYSDFNPSPILKANEEVTITTIHEDDGEYYYEVTNASGKSDNVLTTEVEVLVPTVITTTRKPRGRPAKTVEPAIEVEDDAEEATSEDVEKIDNAITDDIAKYIEGQDPCVAVKQLLTRIEADYYDVGGLLSYIDTFDIYRRVEPTRPGVTTYDVKNGFQKYVENELSIKPRKAAYLISIYRYFSEMGIAKDKLASYGWSSIKELVGITDNRDRLLEVLESVKNLSIAQIQEFKRQYQFREQQARIRNQGNEVNPAKSVEESAPAEENNESLVDMASRISRTYFRFSVEEGEQGVIEKAIQLAKQQFEVDEDNQAIVYIFGSYLQSLDEKG